MKVVPVTVSDIGVQEVLQAELGESQAGGIEAADAVGAIDPTDSPSKSEARRSCWPFNKGTAVRELTPDELRELNKAKARARDANPRILGVPQDPLAPRQGPLGSSPDRKSAIGKRGPCTSARTFGSPVRPTAAHCGITSGEGGGAEGDVAALR